MPKLSVVVFGPKQTQKPPKPDGWNLVILDKLNKIVTSKCLWFNPCIHKYNAFITEAVKSSQKYLKEIIYHGSGY